MNGREKEKMKNKTKWKQNKELETTPVSNNKSLIKHVLVKYIMGHYTANKNRYDSRKLWLWANVHDIFKNSS